MVSSFTTAKKLQNPEYILDANVKKSIEQLKAHIIQGYPDYP